MAGKSLAEIVALLPHSYKYVGFDGYRTIYACNEDFQGHKPEECGKCLLEKFIRNEAKAA